LPKGKKQRLKLRLLQMIRILILLSPVYVSLFWIIALQSNKKNQSPPAKFLKVFMFIAVICFFGQFLFFAPYPTLFPYWEPVLAYLGSMSFPVYYIYFRLLTVDDKFTFQKHAKYLIVPFLIATVYTVGIFLTPFDQYKAWLYNDSLFPDSPNIQFLDIMRKIIKLTFVVLLVVTYILNKSLLSKYGHKAEQYYSDIQDGKYNNAQMLNYFLIIISLGCLTAHIVGRKLLLPSDTIVNIIWLIFAGSLYGIGYMGFIQKSVNPTYELENNEDEITTVDSELNVSQTLLLNKIISVFEEEKIFLNSNLNITDVVQKVGSNRSYISSIINKKYNQNFCSFVNNFRLSEFEHIYIQNPSLSNEMLAEKCGFGSVNSMKRVIANKSGDTINSWKRNIFKSVSIGN
jgi:AraC-like DNA-binding protein